MSGVEIDLLTSPIASGDLPSQAVQDSSGNGTTDFAVVKEAPLNPTYAEYGVKFDGSTDDTAAWTAAFAALPAKGAEVYVPPLGTSIVSQIAVPTNSTDVVIRGGGGGNNNSGACRLLSHYAGSGAVFAANAAAGFRMSGLSISNDNASFTGQVLDMSRGSGTQDTTQFRLENFRLTAVAQAASTVRLLKLTKATIGNLQGVYFNGAGYAVEGLTTAGDYCNAITIGAACNFSQQDTIAIHNLGNGCTVAGATFEPLRSGAAGAYLVDSTLPANGLTWSGNWTGDSSASGTWITFNGKNLTVLGGLLDQAVDGIKLNGTTAGIFVDGVWFNNQTNGINLNSQTFTGLHVGAGNTFNSVSNQIANSGGGVVRSNDGIILGDSGSNAVSFEAANGNGRGYFRVKTNGNPVIGNSGSGDVVAIGNPSSDNSWFQILGTIQNSNSGNEATTATAGTSGSPPAQVKGYLIAKDHTGTTIKFPYYAA